MAAKVKLTPEQLAEKKEHDALLYIGNRVRGAFSFGKIKTLGELFAESGYSKLGYSDKELSAPVDFKFIKEWLDDRRIELTTKWWLHKNPPQVVPEEIDAAILQAQEDLSDRSALKQAEKYIKGKVELTIEEPDNNNYGLHPSAKEKAYLFWFQKKAIKELWDKTIEVY
jgi:hypothetical protein